MIRIVNCFHLIADPEMLTDSDWQEGCVAGRIDDSFIKRTLNASDESALELSCRFRDKCKSADVSLSGLTIGDSTSDSVLKTLYALGFDSAVRIAGDEEPGRDTADGREAASVLRQCSSEKTALYLSSWIRENCGCDLVITGNQSADGNHGKVPVLIAEYLGISCVANVMDFEPADDNGAYVSWQTDDGSCHGYISFPAVLSVGTVSDAYLRVPTIRQRMQIGKKEIIKAVIVADSEIMAEPGCIPELVSIEALSEKRDAVLIDGSDPETAADIMIGYYRRWKER